jgi:sodium-dependent phosphate cotransporter
LSLEQIFPYTLGANVGTTFTAILASLATGNPNAVEVAFVHLLFNIVGIAIWWPLRRVPLWLSGRIATYAIRNRIFPFAYLLLVFFLLPLVMIFLLR